MSTRSRDSEDDMTGHNNQRAERVPLLFIAGTACLISLPLIYLVTRPMLQLIQAAWMAGPILALLTFLPVTVAFIILYFSAWHEDWPNRKRIFSGALSACLIYGIDVLIGIVLLGAACLIAGLARSVGGN